MAIVLLAAGCGGIAAPDMGAPPDAAALPVQTNARPCPAKQPTAGTACVQPDGFSSIQCEYGTKEDFQCNVLASCTSPAAGGHNTWFLDVPGMGCEGPMSAADAAAPVGCPEPRPHIGDPCDHYVTCWYPGTPWPLMCLEGYWEQDPPQ